MCSRPAKGPRFYSGQAGRASMIYLIDEPTEGFGGSNAQEAKSPGGITCA